MPMSPDPLGAAYNRIRAMQSRGQQPQQFLGPQIRPEFPDMAPAQAWNPTPGASEADMMQDMRKQPSHRDAVSAAHQIRFGNMSPEQAYQRYGWAAGGAPKTAFSE